MGRGMGKRVKAIYLHENDWWSAYTWMANAILISLNQFLEHEGHGFPGYFHGNGGNEAWKDVLVKMQKAFTLLAAEADGVSSEEEQVVIDEGLALFCKFFQGIWD